MAGILKGLLDTGRRNPASLVFQISIGVFNVVILVLNLHLRRGPGRFDFRQLGGETDAVQISFDRRPVGDGSYYSHPAAAVGTDFHGKTERAGEQGGPEQAQEEGDNKDQGTDCLGRE